MDQEISLVPSIFARLVYLSSLRDHISRRYRHYSLAQVHGEEEAERAVRECHRETFEQWLCFTLERQQADLDLYFANLPLNRAAVLNVWIKLAPYTQTIPDNAEEPERQLFCSDFEAILEIMTAESAPGKAPQPQPWPLFGTT